MDHQFLPFFVWANIPAARQQRKPMLARISRLLRLKCGISAMLGLILVQLIG